MSTPTLLLDVYCNGRLVETRTLHEPKIKIGRLETSHVRLDHPDVARMHAVIEVAGSDLRVIDLGSASGTRINAAAVDRHAAIGEGDRLQIGPFELVVRQAAVATAARPVEASTQATLRATGTGQPVLHTEARAVRPAGAVPRTAPPVIEVSDVEDDTERVTQVIASYRGSVVDVQHVGQTTDRSRRAPIWLAAGGALMVAGIGLFGYEASRDWETHRARVAAAAEAGRPVPAAPGLGLGGLGLGLALLGLVPFVHGLSRRSDRGCTEYTLGEDPEATFHLGPHSTGSDVRVPLVRGGARPTLAFSPAMHGVIEASGQRCTLAQLVASGRAASEGSWSTIALPADARARIEVGDVTFDIAAVARGKTTAKRSDTDRPFWIYNGASLAALGSLLLLLHLMPDETLDLSLEDTATDNRFVGFMNQPDERPDEPVAEETAVDEEDAEAGGQGQRHAGNEGRMGDPKERSASGVYAMQKRAVPPTLARNFDPELAARKAGILGQMELIQGHFIADAAGAAFASGLDEQDVWGSLHGTEVGAAYGVAGMGLVGTGRGGGGTADGVIGLGHVGLIGKGGVGGQGIGIGRGDDYGNTKHGPRRAKKPLVRVAKTTQCSGCVDKDIIRRVVRSHINEVRHCYNQGLVRDPNLRGRVAVQFTIGPVGKVVLAASVDNTLGDANVARCVAKAVKRWQFPRPASGGRALVTYPFVFEPG